MMKSTAKAKVRDIDIDDVKDDVKTLESRRGFLRSALGVGMGVGVSAAAVALSTHTAAAAGEKSAVEAPVAKGYRLTPHIAEYYKTAAF